MQSAEEFFEKVIRDPTCQRKECIEALRARDREIVEKVIAWYVGYGASLPYWGDTVGADFFNKEIMQSVLVDGQGIAL